MTLIAGKIDKDGTVWMGADSFCGNAYNGYIIPNGKVRKKDGYLFGITGSGRFSQIIEHHVNLPSLPKTNSGDQHIIKIVDLLSEGLNKHHLASEKDNIRRIHGSVLIGWHGRLYTIFSDFQYVRTIIPYACVGCGEDFGLSAIYSTLHQAKDSSESILYALRAASHFGPCVEPPFVIKNTDGFKKTYKK